MNGQTPPRPSPPSPAPAGDLEFEGTELQLGRRTFVMPALSLGAIKRAAARIQQFAALPLDQQADLTCELVHAALKRNYPDVTREQVDELVDMRNMERVFLAVMQTSGFTAQSGGNGTGGTSQPTGQPSTPT